MTASDLHWLVGLLEGEGCFGAYRVGKRPQKIRAKIRVAMTDEDVVRRAAALMDDAHVRTKRHPSMSERQKDQYEFTLTGEKAAAWMRRLRPLMGKRRGARIGECLALHGTPVAD